MSIFSFWCKIKKIQFNAMKESEAVKRQRKSKNVGRNKERGRDKENAFY